MKTVLLASAAALALSAGAAYAGAAHPATGVSNHFTKHYVFGGAPGSTTLYDQNGNDSGAANTSQNFEATYDQYDNQGADDFTVPSGHKWIVKEVDVTGQYRYSGGVADTANVFFYKNKGNFPGKLAAECDNVNTNDPGTGDFKLKLGKDCPVHLKAGHYWVSVQANLNFQSAPEQWYWETNTSPKGSAAAWQNPGGGFGVGCTTWGTLSSCLGGSGDWMFALRGKDKVL